MISKYFHNNNTPINDYCFNIVYQHMYGMRTRMYYVYMKFDRNNDK